MSSAKTTPSVGARPSTRSSPTIACSTIPARASTVAATRSIASRARSRPLTLTFDISQLPGPRNWATAGGANGDRGALGRRRFTPGLILSLPGTAGLPPFISFSTSYHENIQTQSFCGRRQHRNDCDGGLGQLELGSVGSEPNIAGPEDDLRHFGRQRSPSHDRHLSQEGCHSSRPVFWRVLRTA